VSDSIERYLAAQPDAGDSAVGIRQWWLTDLGFDATDAEVKEALDLLVKDGKVDCHPLRGETILYSRAKAAPPR
jgi:hypothetical protein